MVFGNGRPGEGGALGTGLLVVLLWNYFMRRKANRSAQSPAEKKRYLKQARCEIEAILSSVTSMVLELGLDGVIIRVIPTRYQYKLKGPMEIVGRHVRHFLPRLSEEEIGDILQRVIKNNTREDMQYPVELDRTRWLNLCLTPLKANSVFGGGHRHDRSNGKPGGITRIWSNWRTASSFDWTGKGG